MRPETVTRLEIDLDRLVNNYAAVCRYVPPAEVMAVVKSEAYGHGAVAVARALHKAGCRQYAVAMVDEGIQLRRAGLTGEIMVLGATLPTQFPAMAHHELTPVLPDVQRMQSWAQVAQSRGEQLPYHIKVDVGLGRMGFMPWQGEEAAQAAASLRESLRLMGISGHLSAPGTGGLEYNETEYRRYLEFAAPFETLLPGTPRHLASSQPAVRFRHMHLDLVRIGSLLYGLKSLPEGPPEVLPVMAFKTSVAQVKALPPGWHIGYDMAHRVEEETTVALLPLGWTDGLMTSQVEKADVLVRGRRCRLVGLCTDFAMVDVTGVPGAVVGDEAVIIGTQGDETIPASELARRGGVTTAQALGKISLRVPRLFIQGGKVTAELSILEPESSAPKPPG